MGVSTPENTVRQSDCKAVRKGVTTYQVAMNAGGQMGTDPGVLL